MLSRTRTHVNSAVKYAAAARYAFRDRNETRDPCELRALLEGHAYARSLPLLTPEDIARAEALVAQQKAADASDVARLLDIDQRFHELLLSRCPNRELLATLSRLWNRIQILRAQVGAPQEWNAISIEGHRRVLASIRAGEWDRSREVLARNMERSRDDIVTHLRSLERGRRAENAID